MGSWNLCLYKLPGDVGTGSGVGTGVDQVTRGTRDPLHISCCVSTGRQLPGSELVLLVWEAGQEEHSAGSSVLETLRNCQPQPQIPAMLLWPLAWTMPGGLDLSHSA